jgi:hypothetical protein
MTAEHDHPLARRRQPAADLDARAETLWPRLNPHDLREAHGNPERIVHLVEARSSETYSVLLTMLMGDPSAEVAAGQGGAARVGPRESASANGGKAPTSPDRGVGRDPPRGSV